MKANHMQRPGFVPCVALSCPEKLLLIPIRPLSKENTRCTQGQLLRGPHRSLSVCNVLINVLSQTLLPDSQQSEDLAQDSMASVAKAPLSSKSCMFDCC